MRLKIKTSPLGHQVNGNPRGVGGDQGSRFSVFFNAGKYLLFDIQSLHNHFDNPIYLSDLRQMIFDVSRSNSMDKPWVVQWRRLLLERLSQGAFRQKVSGLHYFFEVCGFDVVQIWNNIQKQYLNTNIG